MSGNLKILVHKSWHVWKRENREKVARDERNFKEDNERKEEKQKNLLQERNLELLQLAESQQQVVSRDFNAEDHSAIGSDGNEKVHIDKPFRLFGDIEELDKRTNEIKDQIRAAKDKELNDKKRSGEAPWALGEGAAEKIGSVVPYWYMKPSTTTAGSSSSSSSSSSRATEIKSEWGEKEIKEENMKEREEIRKHAMDPMCGLLKSENKIRKIDGRKMIIKDELNSHYTKVAVKEERDSSSNGHRNKRAREKEFEESYERDRHHRGGQSANHHRLSDASGSSSSSSARDGSRGDKKERQDYKGKIVEVEDEKISKSTALMRLKRIEREYVERKRAALVLAKADIYGAPLDVVGVSNLPDGRAQRYHQQFHPHIAR